MHVEACINAHCGSSVKFVQAWLSARKHRESNFHHCGGSVKLLQACLSAGKVRDCSFNHCGDLCSSCGHVYIPGDIEKAVLTTGKVL